MVDCGGLWLSFFWSISMSVEKIFQSESSTFQFVFWALFMFCMVFLGLFLLFLRDV